MNESGEAATHVEECEAAVIIMSLGKLFENNQDENSRLINSLFCSNPF